MVSQIVSKINLAYNKPLVKTIDCQLDIEWFFVAV